MIIEYKLDINSDRTLTTPGWVLDPGYFFNPTDNTYVGWTPNSSERKFKVPDTVTELSLTDLISRALALHSINPWTKGHAASDTTELTEAEIQAQVTAWYNDKEGIE